MYVLLNIHTSLLYITIIIQVVGCHPPVQGVKVKPTSGCIAAGGKTELAFQLTATELGSFESWFKLRLKEGRTLTLRVTGSVELPRVYTDLVSIGIIHVHVHVISMYIYFHFHVHVCTVSSTC